MKTFAMFTLLVLAIACGKEDAGTTPGDTGGFKKDAPAEVTKTADDMKKTAEKADAPNVEMRTITLDIEGMN